MAKKWANKDPADVADYGFNWAPLIGNTLDGIAETTCEVVEGSVVKDIHQIYQGQSTVTRLSGGVEGETCLITLHVKLESGQEFDQDIRLAVKQRK